MATQTKSPQVVPALIGGATVTRKPVSISSKLMDLQEIKKTGARVQVDRQITLNDAAAQVYVDLPGMPEERKIIDGHVQFLVDEMNKGNFNPLLVILACCWFEKVKYRINGHHTCWAKMFVGPKYNPTVREIVFEADSIDQVRKLYTQFDRNKVRTEGHLIKVQLVGDPLLDGVWADTIQKLGEGLKFWLFGDKADDYRRCRSEDIANIVKTKYPDLFRTVALFYQKDRKNSEMHIRRSPVLAAMLATFEKVPTIAPEFWGPVRTGANLEVGDARLVLRNYLLMTGIDVSKGIKANANRETMYRTCINAWNRWRKGESVNVSRDTKTRLKPV